MTPDWQTRAVCIGVPWLMDPPEDLQTAENEALALALCGRCPVLDDCRDWVLSLDVDPGGIAGALTEDERTHIRATVGEPRPCSRCHEVQRIDQCRPIRRGLLRRDSACRTCRNAECTANNRRRHREAGAA